MAKKQADIHDMNAYQTAHNYRLHCGMCVKEYYSSLVRICPVSGRSVCMYCCRACEECLRVFGSQGCRKSGRSKGGTGC